MTAIAGVADAGRVVIGGDSAGIAGWELSLRADGKVFRNGPMLFGFTTSFRMGQLLRHSLTVPPRAEGQDRESARDRVKLALSAAEANNAAVRGPFHIESL